MNAVVTVKATVNAIVFAVVSNIKRRKKGDGVAKVALPLALGSTSDVL